MSEEAVVIESAASAEVQAEAEKMGWIPPARYRGEPERFVDADTFLERGETVLPIVKKQLATERETTRQQSVQIGELGKQLKAAQDAIADIEERHTVATQKAVERARADLKLSLERASEAGDHAAVAQITEQMTDLATAVKEKETPKKEEVKREEYKPDPELVAWNAENDWFGPKDRKRTALALATAEDMRADGDKRQGRDFFEAVKDEVFKLMPLRSAASDKVEGARHSADGDTRTAAKKSYASLPADAKRQCEEEARQFVGDGKRYKTKAEWQAKYADLYFSME